MTMFACRSIQYAAFMVESSKGGGKFYLVEFDRARTYEKWKCTCPAFEHHQGHCKHTRMMLPRLCKWQQNLTPEVEPLRNEDGRLHCPVCTGDVFVDTSVFDDKEF